MEEHLPADVCQSYISEQFWPSFISLVWYQNCFFISPWVEDFSLFITTSCCFLLRSRRIIKVMMTVEISSFIIDLKISDNSWNANKKEISSPRIRWVIEIRHFFLLILYRSYYNSNEIVDDYIRASFMEQARKLSKETEDSMFSESRGDKVQNRIMLIRE